MVRAPCCDKMGLKKGPWTREEDQILIHYINQYGHGNWRALPKLAGLLRCGKSCRLRWTNYLRPDIKRGNFNKEEEDNIIKLHALLGNRWSAIAARLPGRTDNEIKNVWNTHLRKRAKHMQPTIPATKHTPTTVVSNFEQEPQPLNFTTQTKFQDHPTSPSSDISSLTSAATSEYNSVLEMDEIFWSDIFPAENSGVTGDFPAVEVNGETQIQIPFPPLHAMEYVCGNMHGEMDLWFDFFTDVGKLPDF